MRIDEPVTVELSPGGAPVRFEWRGERYGVVSVPEPWIGRRAWWDEPGGRAPRGAGPALLETSCWRVDAIALTGRGVGSPDASYDLARRPGTREWRLAAAHDDALDERLFA
ncbi:hypothetical protein USB125703_00036 [Pseudoclavibacter triregionum]|nr:hypothetical protein USB125703_00036 [Pseudoclavibacter triregionum]